jgi:hypothetical protein
MEIMQWAYFNNTSRKMNDVHTQIQQTTTSYRPNEIICDITTKNIPLPFEAKMSRPFYHMDRAHEFAETFYCSDSYAMGNIQMTIVDNPNQQMVWSLVAEGTDEPLCFSGGHPMRKSTSGHSPYTQTLQSKGTLILMTAPTKILTDADTLIAPNYSKIIRPNLWHLPASEQGKNFEIRNRQKYGRAELFPLKKLIGKSANSYQTFFEKNQGSASSWFYYPNSLQLENKDGIWILEANETYIAVIPLTEESFKVAPQKSVRNEIKGSAGKFFKDYSVLVFPSEISGFIVETAEKSEFESPDDFLQSIKSKTILNTSDLNKNLSLTYQSIAGDKMEMKYQPGGLRCEAMINGKKQDWDNFTDGAVYISPYINVKNGKMTLSNGTNSYSIKFKENTPEWRQIK